MGKWYLVIIVLSLFSCKTAKIKGNSFETSNAFVELGAIGHSKTFFLDKDFSSRTYPKLQNKIRLEVQVLPFTKELYKKYNAKAEFNQQQKKIEYIDSVSVKPEFVTIRFLDIQGYVSELNEEYNAASRDFIKASGKGSLVSAIALAVEPEDIINIRAADAFYLINKQDHKYELALFSGGKQISTMDLKSADTFGYQISNFCWILNKKGRWEVADITPHSKNCKGTMTSVATEKKASKNLFKM